MLNNGRDGYQQTAEKIKDDITRCEQDLKSITENISTPACLYIHSRIIETF